MIGRRGIKAATPPPGVGPTDPDDTAAPGEVDRAGGPFDVAEADDAERIGLGAIAVPLVAGAEVRLELEQQSRTPIAVTVVLGNGAVQLRAFASPRSGGLWDEMRAEIMEQLQSSGGKVREHESHFGTEVLATVPAQDPQGQQVVQPLRFVGFEGPRWLLQGIFFGQGAFPETAAELEAVFRSVVVSRGEAPMPPKAPLPLQMPEEASLEDGVELEPDESDSPLDPFERGPEITEIR